MVTAFHNKLIDLLKTDSRFVDDEDELVKAAVIDRAWKIDHDLVKLLLTDSTIKTKFFEEIGGHWIFNNNTFIEYVSDKNFLDNSYTRFRNQIGLNIEGKFLRERGEISLVWPYKDCFLEGGQTTEEEERKEIFFNEILAQDEIDRLVDPKVIVNWKRYTPDGVQKVTQIKRDENGTIAENLIIKGNNILALHSIINQFRGKIKLIYIDPPYNTGSDSFRYNDNFNQSSWLTFVRNRLEIAKEFLSSDGSIFVSIDENEIGYIQILMDEIFGKENRANIITVKRGSVTGHKSINPGVVNLTEYLVSYAKNKGSWKPKRLYRKRDRNVRYNNFILNRNKPVEEWEFCSLTDAFSQSKEIPKNKIRKELGPKYEDEIFEFITLNADAVIQYAYPDQSKVSSDIKEFIIKSKKTPNKIFHIERTNEADFYLRNGQRLLFYSERLQEIDGEIVTVERLSDLWDDVLPNDLHNEGGVSLKKGKKPEKLISRIIEMNTSPKDLFMDFHLGSGTSVAVAHKIGRRYIGIEQLEYGENDTVTRLRNVIGIKKEDVLIEEFSNYDKSGISKSTNWQGGGEFIFCELMKYNETFMDKNPSNKIIQRTGKDLERHC